MNVWDCSTLPMMGSKLCELDLFESTWKSPVPGHRIISPPPLISIQKFKTQIQSHTHGCITGIWFLPRMLSWGRMKQAISYMVHGWFPSRTGSND